MTDWHCMRCRRRVRLYRHSTGVPCASCLRVMRRGRGKRNSYDHHHATRTAERDRQLAEPAETRPWLLRKARL